MDVHRLVQMANDIGSFFGAEKDKTKAEKGVADHIRNFWEPRMRLQILAYLDEQEGAGMTDLVRGALRTYRQNLMPSDQ
jgi:formate dehydrogenase subunit delta